MQILKEIDKKGEHIDKKRFSKNLKRIIKIRNLYGHVPCNLFSKELSFEDDGIYSQWAEDTKGKSIKELNREFKELYDKFLAESKIFVELLRKSLDETKNNNYF